MCQSGLPIFWKKGQLCRESFILFGMHSKFMTDLLKIYIEILFGLAVTFIAKIFIL